MGNNNAQDSREWNHSSHEQFFDDYLKKSQNSETYERFLHFYDIANQLLNIEANTKSLKVADIGCGAGTQSSIWAKKGHTVYGLDVNEPLIGLARKRAQEENLVIHYEVGSATELPWPDQWVDVCLVPELLEHVAEWETVLEESTRIVRPGGLLIITTNNKLCPFQQEFNLPLYSWYPGFLKHYCEKLAMTSKPGLANYATYPAVNWFTFFALQKWLTERGFNSDDRFDIMDTEHKSSVAKVAIGFIKKFYVARWFAHVATPYTFIAATKRHLGP